MSLAVRKSIRFAATLTIASTVCPLLFADHHAKNIDPSGSWRWSDDRAGYEVNNVLRLLYDDKTGLTGTYEGHSQKPVAIRDGKVSGNQIAMVIEYEHVAVGRITIQLDGKIEQDTLNAETSWSGGAVGSSTLKCRRTVLAEDVVGKWSVSFVDPQGVAGEAELELEMVGGKLAGRWRGKDGTELKLKTAHVEDNELRVTFQTKHDSMEVDLAVSGRPYGNRLKGRIEYDADGNVGDFGFEAERRKSDKN